MEQEDNNQPNQLNDSVKDRLDAAKLQKKYKQETQASSQLHLFASSLDLSSRNSGPVQTIGSTAVTTGGGKKEQSKRRPWHNSLILFLLHFYDRV